MISAKLFLYHRTDARWLLCCRISLLNVFPVFSITIKFITSLEAHKKAYLLRVFSTYPAPQISVPHAFFIEVIIAAILVCLILALTDDGNGVPRGPLAPLLIGILIAVIGGHLALTGFALNPARDFGPKVVAYLAGWGDIALTGGRDIPYFLVPLTAPIVGGLLGAFAYRKLIGRHLPCMVCEEETKTENYPLKTPNPRNRLKYDY